MTAYSITASETGGTTDLTITAAATVTCDPVLINASEGFGAQLRFAYGSGGASVKAYLQGSLDGGNTYFDLACVLFATASEVANLGFRFGAVSAFAPTNGTMADDSILNSGTIPVVDRLRLKVISAGTYAASTLLSGRVVYA